MSRNALAVTGRVPLCDGPKLTAAVPMGPRPHMVTGHDRPKLLPALSGSRVPGKAARATAQPAGGACACGGRPAY